MKIFLTTLSKKNDHDNNNKYNDNENDHSNCNNNSTLKINIIHGKLFTIYYLTYIMNTLCKGDGLLTVSIF